MFTANLMWGLNAPIGKAVLAEFTPMSVTTFRMVGAAVAFWVLSFFCKKENVENKDLLKLFFAALFGVVFNQGAFIFGLSLSDAALGRKRKAELGTRSTSCLSAVEIVAEAARNPRVAQIVRDARVAMIYEGTNTVQSLDLLGRKVLGNNGATLQKFGKLVGKLQDLVLPMIKLHEHDDARCEAAPGCVRAPATTARGVFPAAPASVRAAAVRA